jgi:o-succinylbenzoate synthase
MNEEVWYHRYVLRAGAALNSASTRIEFPGALLRVGDGFAALHPWPEFGDAPLNEQLHILAAGGSTPLLERTLHIAAVDAEARCAGVSLFEGLEIPPSHYSWSFGQPTWPQMDFMRDKGFRAVKVKGFNNYGETTRFLDATSRAMPELRLRVDFNGCLDPISFRKFVEFMPLRVYRQMDLIEDPAPYEDALWNEVRNRWRVRLALDKGWQHGQSGFDVVVVKPARRDWRAIAQRHPGVPLMLTSAMDHPLGQAWAAYESALAWLELGDNLELGGLITQHLFKRDPFSAKLGIEQGGTLQVDRQGTGLGFDEELHALDWHRLR